MNSLYITNEPRTYNVDRISVRRIFVEDGKPGGLSLDS